MQIPRDGEQMRVGGTFKGDGGEGSNLVMEDLCGW